MPATQDSPNASATDRWNAAVARHVNRGLSREKAIAAVAAEDPKLHASYVAEYNGRPEPAADKPAAPGVIAEWTALVDSFAARGMSRTKAVQAAATQNPDLHAAYLQQYNAQARRRR